MRVGLSQLPVALPIVLIINAAEPLSRQPTLKSPARKLSSTVQAAMIFCWLLQEFPPANLYLEAPQTFPYARDRKSLLDSRVDPYLSMLPGTQFLPKSAPF
jgi:hypothetical protein